MAAKQITTTLRSLISTPLVFVFSLYVVSLTCSMAGMEITSWATALLLIIYMIIDKASGRKTLELHANGAELPLLIFLIVAAVGLRLNAPEADFLSAYGSLRNLVLIFAFTYVFQIAKSLNRFVMILWVMGCLVALYAIARHFTGYDLLTQTTETAGAPAVGFFGRHLTFGHSFMMILCIPWAAILLGMKKKLWQVLLFTATFIAILLSLIYTDGHGVWIAIIVALPVMALFSNRKLFLITLALVAIGGGTAIKVSQPFREKVMSVFVNTDQSAEVRQKIWQTNLDMFHEHPWIGVGYKQNEKPGADGTIGHPNNTYIELLATTGALGFGAYMLFITAFVLMTARLFSTIPRTHYWHKVFALSAMGAQIAFHIGGLTQWNFGDGEVQHQFIFWVALVSYMSQRYYAHIVPDDRSL